MDEPQPLTVTSLAYALRTALLWYDLKLNPTTARAAAIRILRVLGYHVE